MKLLPGGFVLSKPIEQKDYDEKVIEELEKNKSLIITRKRDGWKLFAEVDVSGEINFYTAGLKPVDDRLDHIKSELVSLGFPPKTLLVGEAIFDENGRDDIARVQAFFKSSPEKALQSEDRYKIKLMLFGVIFYDGLDLIDKRMPYRRIFDIFDIIEGHPLNGGRYRYVTVVERLEVSLKEAKKLVCKKKWEGLVLYDAGFINKYRLDGKAPQRPKGCYKWKPILEDDFFVKAEDRVWSSDDPKRLKKVVLKQIDPRTGKEFSCGKLATFNKDMRDFLSQKRNYPLVMQVEFEMRFKSGKIRNARFVRLREDKKPQECIGPKNLGGKS